jgi:hypothetical protein
VIWSTILPVPFEHGDWEVEEKQKEQKLREIAIGENCEDLKNGRKSGCHQSSTNANWIFQYSS